MGTVRWGQARPAELRAAWPSKWVWGHEATSSKLGGDGMEARVALLKHTSDSITPLAKILTEHLAPAYLWPCPSAFSPQPHSSSSSSPDASSIFSPQDFKCDIPFVWLTPPHWCSCLLHVIPTPTSVPDGCTWSSTPIILFPSSCRPLSKPLSVLINLNKQSKW